MESLFLEGLKKKVDVTVRGTVWSGHRHELMVGLDDFISLSNLNDSMVISRSEMLITAADKITTMLCPTVNAERQTLCQFPHCSVLESMA